jgi:spore coat protein CotF
MNLTTKERYLLEDQRNHEQICIQKYSNYANMASDQQLKDIFNQNAQKEREHLNTINQILSGQIPVVNQQGSGSSNQQQQKQPQQQQQQQQSGTMSQQGGAQNYQATDKYLCTDMLMTEKYVSDSYDTAIFEFKDPQIRNVLNHIQKEEQQHGEAIFNYMNSKGMYSAQ